MNDLVHAMRLAFITILCASFGLVVLAMLFAIHPGLDLLALTFVALTATIYAVMH